MEVEQIAEVCHEVNRALCNTLGEAGQLPWNQAAGWQKESAINGVKAALKGNTPDQSHESWMREKVSLGWTYGPVKSETNKTHPCMLPRSELPATQRLKDDLFVAICNALKEA